MAEELERYCGFSNDGSFKAERLNVEMKTDVFDGSYSYINLRIEAEYFSFN